MPKKKSKIVSPPSTPFDIILENVNILEKSSETKPHLEAAIQIKDAIQEIQSKYDNFSDTLKSVDKQKIDLESQLQKSIQEIELWKEKFNLEKLKEEAIQQTLEMKEKTIGQIKEESKKVVEDFSDEMKILKSQKETLEKQITNYVFQIRDLSGSFINQLNIKEKEIVSLNNLVDKKNALIQQVKNELDSLQGLFQQSKKEYLNLKTQYDDVLEDANQIKQISEEKVNEITKELQEKAQLVKELNAQLSNLQVLIKKYKSKCEIL